ncbi:MAG TPA: glycosyltransferase [Candidatus Eisenbergiella merdavium]|uniref:Glycosyltransferase n=1 Tax=Candidatus Eisenbergiella merdavium TaxID=2838551 RepID=A0A9D2NI42_9FIRM|nr:glycosyltransferase [Candidatus Eisenbergiella merdavium]
MIKTWIDYLKQHRHNLKVFLEDECHINTQKLSENNGHTFFSDKLQAKSLKELRVGAIMDRFTLDCYRPECSLLELTPQNWKEEINSFRPELIFIESAWQGKDGLWYRKIANGSPELYEMTSYCHEKGIPVVFWNKEDPIYTDTFMPAAQCADFVFTTDIDCIRKYKDLLGHENVFFLHFAAQPAIHNPIEKYVRKDRFCFAGAYYHRYPERSKTFDAFSEFFIAQKGMDIYDRNHVAPRPEHAFPERYRPYILGTLDPSEIDKAYKGYNYGINMNSVWQSQTMFARRVFEMLASNTVTIGNYSRGLKNLFGDLTICTNDAKTLSHTFRQYCTDSEASHKYRLLGLRKVLSEHLYEDRLGYISRKVYGKDLKSALPPVTLLANPAPHELNSILTAFKRQEYAKKHLILFGEYKEAEAPDISVISAENLYEKNVSSLISDGFIGVLNGKNYYGKNYLQDLVLTLRYMQVDGIGKSTYYSNNTLYGIQLKHPDRLYSVAEKLKTDRSIFSHDFCGQFTLNILFHDAPLKNGRFFSVDEFNFCENFQGDACPTVDDMILPDQGIPLTAIEAAAEKIQSDMTNTALARISSKELAGHCSCSPSITTALHEADWNIRSSLEEKAVQYVYLDKWYEAAEYVKENKLSLQFTGRGNLDLLGTCVFYDDRKGKISPAFPRLNTLSSIDIPENAKYFRLGFRISGSGECNIREILIGLEKSHDELSCFLSRSNVLVLSNQYPSPEALYRNMFVHKRALSYKESGFLCDVMRMNIFCRNSFQEFEGINVIEGQADRLYTILESGTIDTVCVHFLDEGMWNVLRRFGKRLRILVWLHGAEIQLWWRRKFNYTTPSELEKAKKESEKRQVFWKTVFDGIDNYNLHFIFVSEYFANESFKDNNIPLPLEKYSIIHNCIDTDLFQYNKKPAEQRKKLLSIRPYASSIYANDLTAKTIIELSKEPFFHDLEFRIIGNGEQFDAITSPLKRYKNVILEKRFLRQDEIAALHQSYGIFIIPTRSDTQGVSRDEAMSSGLVPVTNAVTAIPEFVDDSCGILAPAEDYKAMAEGIKRLYQDPDLFETMSQNAAERVRRQSSKELTIGKEIGLIYKSR